MAKNTYNLSVAEVFERCSGGWVPVGVSAAVAIEAHRVAMSRNNTEMAFYALRACVVSRMVTAAECQAMLEHLETTAPGDWDDGTPDGLQAREEVLAWLVRRRREHAS